MQRCRLGLLFLAALGGMHVAHAGDLGGQRSIGWYAGHCANVDVDRNTEAFRTQCTVQVFKRLGVFQKRDVYYGLYKTQQFWRKGSEDAKSIPPEEIDQPIDYTDLVLFVGPVGSPRVEPVYFFEEEWIRAPVFAGGPSGRSIRFETGNGNKVSYHVRVRHHGGQWVGKIE